MGNPTYDIAKSARDVSGALLVAGDRVRRLVQKNENGLDLLGPVVVIATIYKTRWQSVGTILHCITSPEYDRIEYTSGRSDSFVKVS